MLRISGTDFDVDHFITETNLNYSNIHYKGEPKFRSKPDGKKNLMNAVNFNVSDSDFDKYEAQISDAIAYLEKHKDQLISIRSTPGIEFAVIDFGVEFPDDTLFVRNFYFDPVLISACGELGLAIEVSVYREAAADE